MLHMYYDIQSPQYCEPSGTVIDHILQKRKISHWEDKSLAKDRESKWQRQDWDLDPSCLTLIPICFFAAGLGRGWDVIDLH